MTPSHELLNAIYTIVKDLPQPLQYNCTTRELMLRLNGNWSNETLELLQQDEFIEVKKSGISFVVVLTEKGLEKARDFRSCNLIL